MRVKLWTQIISFKLLRRFLFPFVFIRCGLFQTNSVEEFLHKRTLNLRASDFLHYNRHTNKNSNNYIECLQFFTSSLEKKEQIKMEKTRSKYTDSDIPVQ